VTAASILIDYESFADIFVFFRPQQVSRSTKLSRKPKTSKSTTFIRTFCSWLIQQVYP